MERYARFKGSWYPDDRATLSDMIKWEEGKRTSRFAVLPHSGLLYSKEHIKEYFSTLSEDVRRILIISPSHYFYIEPDTLVSAGFTSSETPLGRIETIPLDVGTVSDMAIQAEHGVEMFLPFIAMHANLSVSYLLLSSLSSFSSGEDIAQELMPRIDDETGVIASSDFTHYGPSYNYMPYGSKGYPRVLEEDRKAAALLAEGEAEKAWNEGHRRTICGIAPATIVSIMARESGFKGHVGLLSSSADKGGDRLNFVSYCTVLWGEDD